MTKYTDVVEQLAVTPVGFEPTQLALVELESTPLDHSGKVSCKNLSISFQLQKKINQPDSR